MSDQHYDQSGESADQYRPDPSGQPGAAGAGESSADTGGSTTAGGQPYGGRPEWADTTQFDTTRHTSTTSGQPYYTPYGGFPPPTAPAPVQPAPRRRRRRTAVAVAAVLAAGLIGGGVGAGSVYAFGDHETTPLASNAPVAVAPISASSGSVAAVAKKVLPSVVSIEADGRQESGTGSGIILDTDGHILTNNHVVVPAVNGGELKVTLNDGRTAKADLVGRDPISDLAVIQVKGVDNLKPATLGNSRSLRVGQSVVAVGSPLGLSGTVTSGIVSALERPVVTQIERPSQSPFGSYGQSQGTQETAVDAIQTDAAINPGNSGGPLVDMAGNVVGINSAIASLGASAGGQSGSIGLGFSIPINVAKPIAQELLTSGKATHALLGTSIRDATGESGATVESVTKGGAADAAGLRKGDVVTKLDDRIIPDADSLVAAVRSYRPGDKVTLTIERGGSTKTLHVTLGSDG